MLKYTSPCVDFVFLFMRQLFYAELVDFCSQLEFVVWYGMVWYGMVWYGMVWYGALWYDMVRYGRV